MSTYDIGDRPVATVTFTDLDGTPTDPTTVTATVRAPDGTVTAIEATSAETDGVWTAVVGTLDQRGRWYVRFEGTGALVAAVEAAFEVRPRQVPVPD